jgi:hypothetical protein
VAFKLALLVPHHSDELPVDFCARLAARNFQSASKFALNMGFGLTDFQGNPERALTQLAEVSGTPLASLRDSSLHNVAGKRYSLRGQVLGEGAIRIRQFAVCPQCLQEDLAASNLPPGAAMRLRSHWMVASIGVCAKHHIVLAEVGERFKGQVRRDWSQVAPDLAPRLSAILDAAIRRLPSEFETYQLNRLSGNTSGCWLDRMHFFVAERTVRAFGMLATFGKDALEKSLNDDELRHASDRGYRIVRDGPARIRQFLSEIKQQDFKKKRVAKKKPLSPLYSYGQLYNRLYWNSTFPEFAPVIDVVADFVLSNFPLGPSELVFKRPVDKRRVHSVFTLSKMFGTQGSRTKDILTAGGLLPCLGCADDNAVFDADKAEALMKAEADGLKQRAAEEHLGVDSFLMKELIGKGFVPRHKHSANRHAYRFLKSELDEFLRLLMAQAAPLPAKEAGRYTDIRRASPLSRCKIIDIVGLILGGKLRNIAVQPDTPGFNSVLVDPEEIKSLLDKAAVPVLSVVQVAERLECDGNRIRFLATRKVLDATFVKNRMSGRNGMNFAKTAIDRFDAEFVSLPKLARTQGRNPQSVRAELRKKGIAPFAAPDGSNTWFYRRSELQTR